MNHPADLKFCHACGKAIDLRAEICPHCGVRQMAAPALPAPAYAVSDRPELRDASNKKLAAGICAILVGSLGIHKFILGMNTAGLIMLLITLLTCGVAGIVMFVISVIEGIIYLTKTDEEFYQTYIVQKKDWF